ncbi:MAG: cytochrome C assembly family protein [Thalassotalea sp.]
MDLFLTSTSIAFLSYSVATFAILTRLLTPQGPNLKVVLSFGCLAILFHTFSLSQQLFIGEKINFNLPNVIALVSLVITSVITVVAMKFKINLLLPVTYGFAALWQLLLIFIPPVNQIILSASSFIMVTHITLALVAYSILVIATLYGFQVNYINRKLKDKDLSAVNHLPPLMQVENQLFIIMTMGTICLIASQLLGFIFLENYFAHSQLHKTLLSLAALSLYVITLWGHYQQGWRGHRVLSLTTFATLLLTLAYFGSRFVKEFLLS